MIDTLLSHRLLNPKKMKNSEKIFTFWLIFEVRCFHQSSNLTSVVTKWNHEFSKNSDIFTARENRAILGSSACSPLHFFSR